MIFFRKVSMGAHYVFNTKVNRWQNSVCPPETMAAAMLDPTSPRVYSSNRGAGGALFRSWEAVFGAPNFLAEMLSCNSNRVG